MQKAVETYRINIMHGRIKDVFVEELTGTRLEVEFVGRIQFGIAWDDPENEGKSILTASM